MATGVSPVFPVNENGEIVVTKGTGTATITGVITSDIVPIDLSTGGLALRLPESQADTLPIIVVRQASDLGTPNQDGLYVLQSGIEYHFVGTVNLGDKGLLTPAAAIIKGNSRSSDTIATNRPGFLVVATGGTVRISNVRLTNTGGPLIDGTTIGVNFAHVFSSVAFGPCTYIGRFGTCLAVIFDLECTATGLTDPGAMIRLLPGASVNFLLSHMAAFGNSNCSTIIDLSTATLLYAAIQTTGFLLSSGKTVIEGLSNGANISLGGTGQILNCPIIGGGTISNTILPGDPRWTIFNSSPSRNSSTFANWGMVGNTTVTTTSGTNTPVLGSTMTVNTGTQRFNTNQLTDYVEVVYTDSRSVVVSIDAQLVLQRSGGGGVTYYTVSIEKDSGGGYVVVPESEAAIDVDTTDRAVRSLAVVQLSNNDKIRIAIKRTSGTANVIATSMRVLLREE